MLESHEKKFAKLYILEVHFDMFYEDLDFQKKIQKISNSEYQTLSVNNGQKMASNWILLS